MGRLAEIQRRNLETIMGAEALGIVQAEVSLWDPKVCRSFIAGTCVHDLFANTKMDLGPCTRLHQAKLKIQFEAEMAAAEKAKDQTKIAQLNQFHVDHERTVFGYVDECDRKVRAAQRRLEKTPEENNRTTALMREIGEIEGAYQAAMAEVEQLGSEGKVDESIAELAKAEALKEEKQSKEHELQVLSETSGASGHQKLRVCDICGAYLSVLDSDRRLADHFGGKLHIGYHQIRTMMDDWRARGPLKTAPPPPPESLNRKKEDDLGPPPPTTFRPIPPEKRLKQTKAPPAPAPAPPPNAPTGPAADRRLSGPAPISRESDSHSHSHSHRDSRDSRTDSRTDSRMDDRRSSSRRYDDDDRDRVSSSRRSDDRDRSSRTEDRERSSRTEDRERSSRAEDRERSSRHDDTRRSDDRRSDDRRSDDRRATEDRRSDDRRSSSRRYEDEEVIRSSRRREDDDRISSSRRHRDDDDRRSSARETRPRDGEAEGEEREQDKRRRVD